MSSAPGHEPGHAPQPLDWGLLVEHHREAFGGWAALADTLIHHGPGELPSDAATVEKGLRRLAARGNKPGGQYGRWLLRHLGSPDDVTTWVRELGQYHSRLADLPTGARRQQLGAFDRPPVNESRLAVWIDLGIASVLHREKDSITSRQRLDRALRSAAAAGATAQAEAWLFAARFATDEGDRQTARNLFEQVDDVLGEIAEPDRLCYAARLAGQRAFHFTRPAPGEVEDLDKAKALFHSIDEGEGIPFVGFRKYGGLAWCAGRRGDRTEACRLARRSAEYAADGGLVRFRVMALLIHARFAGPADAEASFKRADRLADHLQDADLAQRVKRSREHRAVG